MSLRSTLLRAGSALHQRAWLTRAMTLGVRAIVFDESRRVLLVRHTYVSGWYLPGGGVDRGETAEVAVVREVFEESGIRCNERPMLHGLYRNGRRDHVACYIVKRFTLEKHSLESSWEIAEAGFHRLDALPDGTTRATRARLAEVFDGAAITPDW